MAMPGIRWRRWRSDWESCDCFGIIVLWFREVCGVDLGPVPQTDIASGFASLQRDWVECGPLPGSTGFMTYRNGVPTHCGMLIHGGQLLHAQAGNPIPESGSVRLTRLAVLARLYPDLRFYRPGHPSC